MIGTVVGRLGALFYVEPAKPDFAVCNLPQSGNNGAVAFGISHGMLPREELLSAS